MTPPSFYLWKFQIELERIILLMKKIISILLCCVFLVAATACTSESGDPSGSAKPNNTNSPSPTPEATPTATPAPVDSITGSAADVLASILEKAGDSEVATMEVPLDAENSLGMAGISAEQLESLVEDSVVSSAMMSSVAHIAVLVKCKDVESAETIKLAMKDNFDVRRWVCVMPEKVFVVDSGTYVMLVASFEDYADALYNEFKAIAGENIGEMVAIPVE
mgnify:FL=1|jgi:hypothetical protein